MTTTEHFSRARIDDLPQRFRANFINSLSGYKSANLVGTINAKGQTNLAIVSSVVHLGASPPMLGMIMRPHSVRRDTIENILETGTYTLNHVAVDNIDKAHQTSARYAAGESEFSATELDEQYLNEFPSPYVEQSPIKLGMQLVESVPITHNNTSLIIGEIVHIYLPESILSDDGSVDLNSARIACISGLDTYHQPVKLARFAYAKAGVPLTEWDANK